MTPTTQNPIILYHANCTDGMGAAFAAWKYFGEEAKYIPVQYGQPMPVEITEGKDEYIFMVDFSYSREVIESLRTRHKRVIVIDHHKTAEAELAGLTDCVFDMKKSGAVLAWEYFHQTVTRNVEVPTILLHVQDRDLWNWEMENTREICLGLMQLKTFKEWDNARAHTLFEQGLALAKYIDDKVDSASKEERVLLKPLTKHSKVRAGIVNTTDNVSEICAAIIKKHGVDVGVGYFVDNQMMAIVSLRSDRNSEVDVSEFAKKYGGGGHKSAAGCKMTMQQLQELLYMDF